MLIAPVAYQPVSSAFALNLPGVPNVVTDEIAQAIGGGLAERFLKRAYKDERKIEPAQVSEDAANLSSADGLKSFLSHAGKLGDIRSLEAAYPSFDVATKILWGRQDKVLDSDLASKLSGALPRASTVFMDACGHIPQEEQPAATNSEIRAFL